MGKAAPVVVGALTALLVGCADAPAPDAWWVAVGEQQASPRGIAASEVSVAVNPLDADHAMAAANSGGGFGVYVTRDGGLSWTAHDLRPEDVAPIPGGRAPFQFLSDPSVAFGPDGTAYLAGLAYVPTSAVFVARSAAGDGTWDAIAIVHESDPATSFNDKEWLAAGPDGTLVVAWQKEPAMDRLRGIEALLGGRADLDLGDIVVCVSSDGGTTWTQPQTISRGLHNNGTQVAAAADGTWHALWVNYETGTLDHARSLDGGTTWEEPRAAADVDILQPFARFARMHTLPALAVDARPGSPSLYAVWHDDARGQADVMAVASDDAGTTWGAPVRVAGDGEDAIQMFPWAAVDGQGRLHVTYYDSRGDAHPRFVLRHAVADAGLVFLEGPASSQPFTAFDAPDGGTGEARSLGDYTGLAALPSGALAAWADGRTDPSSVWAMRIQMSG